jgi:GT2 family glycosyltransferase
MNQKLTLCIVNYNGQRYLRATLQAAREGVSLPRDRFWDIRVPKIDSPTRQPLGRGRPASAAAYDFLVGKPGSTACRMRLHTPCGGCGTSGPFAPAAAPPRLRLPRTTRLVLRTSLAGSDCAGELRETIVFDNASDDGSPEMAEREFPEVKVITLGENRGPASARNAAIDQAASDRIVINDNDVRIQPDCASLLCKALEDRPNAAIAMPSIIFAHDPDTVQFDGADNHFLGQQILHSENRPVADEGPVREMDSLITACFAVDRTRLPHGMRFDESFFIYFEDHDFGVRARLFGKDVLSVPAAHCLHDEGTEGLSLRQLGKYSSMRVFCIIRNRWLFLLRNYSGKTDLVAAVAAHVSLRAGAADHNLQERVGERVVALGSVGDRTSGRNSRETPRDPGQSCAARQRNHEGRAVALPTGVDRVSYRSDRPPGPGWPCAVLLAPRTADSVS